VAVSFDDTHKFVKELADAFSKHAKYVNQVWFASIVAATVVVFPAVSDDGKNIDLPFSLGTVSRPIYAPVGYFILAVLIVAYCQGYAKAYDARKFAHGLIDQLEANDPRARDFYDFFVVDGIARVWPLVSLLKRWFGNQSKIIVPSYIALKIFTQGILLGLPLLALVSAFWQILKTTSSNAFSILASVVLIFVMLAAAEIIYSELDVIRDVKKRIAQ